jgi:hypothetical protein
VLAVEPVITALAHEVLAMDRTILFRRSLLARLLKAAFVGVPVAAVAAFAACGGNVVVDGKGGSTGSGGSTGTTFTGTLIPACVSWSSAMGSCPDTSQAPMYIGGQLTGCDQIVSGPTFSGTQCCYEVEQIPCGGTGRPFLQAGRALTAPVRRAADDPRAWRSEGEGPRLAGLSPEIRARLAEAWTADGLLEHASIASFGRFALELLAVGAPADLVAEAHRAALDEVEHARLCLGLAAAYAGSPIAPAPFPFGGRVEVSADLASIAARAVREGCVGETLGALHAAEQLAGTEDPRVRAALSAIAEDEARHAELAFRFVAWALAHGGAAVRAAVAGAFAEPVALPEPSDLPAEMAAHGRLSPSAARAFAERALAEVIRPCSARMLA